MAIVIPLAPHRRPQSSPSSEPSSKVADILFFTGVRFERPAEPAPMEQPARRKRSPAAAPKRVHVKGPKNARQPA
jgi:hypothetical protein